MQCNLVKVLLILFTNIYLIKSSKEILKYHVLRFIFLFLSFFSVLGIEPRALHMLGIGHQVLYQ